MRRLFLLILALSPVFGGSRVWPEVSPSVWAIKEGTPNSEKGAVIVYERSRYGVRESEFELRIRIFNEAGKAAAQLDPFSEHLRNLDGRVLYPDGRSTQFNDKKDFASQSVKVGGYEQDRKVVIPPGITTDCLLDLHWIVDATYLWGTEFERHILRPFPIRSLKLELAENTPMASVLLGTSAFPPKMQDEEGYRVYQFQNLPAFESVPYSALSMRDNPSLFCFEQPFLLREAAKQGAEAFWKEATEKIFKQVYEQRLEKGRRYRAFSEALRKDLPPDPLKRTQAILQRVEDSVLNISHLTYKELAARTAKQSKEYIHELDLDETVDRRWTNANGIHYLVFELLKDAGLSPKLLLATDRDVRVFRFKLPCLYQFSEVLIGVESADHSGTIWFDPGERFFPPGVLPITFQGTYALEINTSGWSCKQIILPTQPPALNRRVLEYDLKVDGDSEVFSVKATFLGAPEFYERIAYAALEQKEQNKKLKGAFEEANKNLTITKAEVRDAQDVKLNTSWVVEGNHELDGSRRKSIDPFPGMASSMWIPDSWPETRTDEIVVPYCRQHDAVAKIHVPKGWHAGIDPDFSESNDFGRVNWKTRTSPEGDGTLVEVVFEVEASKMFAGPGAYGSMKAFVGWVEKGWKRTVSIERDR